MRSRAASLAGAAALLATAAGLLLPGALGWRALGHAQLVASAPGAGEVLDEPPSQLVLVFSEPLEAAFSAADVTDAAGRRIVTHAGAVDTADAHQLLVDLPPLADGVYTVRWRSLSSADGHTASGFFSFAVGSTGEQLPEAGSTHGAGGDAGPFTAVGRALGYVGPLAGIGLPVIGWVALRGRFRPGVLGALGFALLVSAVAVFAVAARSALGADPEQPAAYLTGSRNGVLQLSRAGLFAVAGLLVIGLAGRAQGAALAVTGAAALGGIGLQVLAGHAAGLPGPAPLVGQAVHVAAVGVWLSGVALLAVLAIRPRLVLERPPPLREVVPRFSALALAAIGLLGVTGIHAAWSQTGTLVDLGTEYGRFLAVKSALALGALGLGGLNYLDGGRLLGWLGGIRTRLISEAGLAVGVLLVTGLLSATPPLDASRGVAIAPVPDAFGRLLAGVSLELVPGRPGVNAVVVSAKGDLGNTALELALERLDGGGRTTIPLRHTDAAGGTHDTTGGAHDAPASDLTHDAPASDLTQADRYVASAVVLPAGSAWDASVRVLVEAGGDELSRQRYTFSMGEAGVQDGQLLSLLDVGIGLAAVLVVGGALAIGLGYGGWRLPRCEPAASRIALGAGGVVALALGALIGLSRLAGVT
jgi:methionine-rich copper-binding protein CopC